MEKFPLVLIFACCLPCMVQSFPFHKTDPDTIKVFDDSIQVILPAKALPVKKRRALVRQFKAQYGINTLHQAVAFREGEKNYQFFHTDIDYPINSDYAVSAWNLFFQITDRIAHNRWLGSGWKVVGRSTVYHMELSAPVEEQLKFFQFTFINLDGKLGILIYECPFSEGLKPDENTEGLPQLVCIKNNRDRLCPGSVRISP